MCVLLLIAQASTARVDAAQADSLDVVDVDTSAHPVVRVVVAAPRELVGRDLPTEAFVVQENGQQRSAKVERLPNEGLEVVLVIDTSGSMAGAAINAAKAAATAFVDEMPAGTRIAVVGFGDTATIVLPFETDPEALKTAIGGLSARGETALYDALSATVEQFSASSSDARRAIVLLSDGGDTVSTTPLDALVSRLAGIEVDFASVALSTSEGDAAVLEQLAAAAGGRVVAADAPDQLADVYSTIASRLVSQHTLTFESRAEGPTQLVVTLSHEGVSASATRSVDLPKLPDGAGGAAAEGAVTDTPVAAPDASFLEQGWWFAVGAVAFAGALGVAGWFLMATREPRRRLAREFRRTDEAMGPGLVPDLSSRAMDLAQRALERSGRTGVLNEALNRAGLAIRPAEFILLAASMALFAGMVGLALGSLFTGVLFAGITMAGFRVALTMITDRRRAAFADQLGDTLQLLAGSLRTGYGLLQSIDAVAREAASPTSQEFGRVVIEAQLGRDVNEALRASAERVGNEDFQWVVQAIQIHREVGGDLAEVLDRVGETIRDRNRIKGQIEALSAEGRLSAVILFLLPIGIYLVLRSTNPDYVGELTATGTGKSMLVFGGVLMVLGGLWLRRIIRLEF